VFGGALSFVLIVVLSFYLSVQEDGIEKFLRIVVSRKHEPYVIGLWKRTQAKIGLWMQGQIVLAVLVGVLVYLGLMVLGIKNALLFAVLAGVLEMIPLFGPIIAAIPAVAAGYADGGTSAGLIIAGLYLIIQQFENHLIYPLVVKKIVGVPPILVILSLLVGFELAGFLGMILSVPLSSMLVEFLDDVQKSRAEAAR
jgi:predicted PurR-regulated permease PerM